MAIILSHISALEYWISISRTRKWPAASTGQISAASYPDASSSILSKLFDLSEPIHVLSLHYADRRNKTSLICHACCEPLPTGSILEITDEILITSPALTFVQCAALLSEQEIIKAGYELCGTYCVNGGILYSRHPITTTSQLKAFREMSSHINGSGKAESALRHILDGSASPMETALVMLLCLPYKRGGYGIVHPLLNHRIYSDTISNASNHYSCDLYWPQAKLAVEYDSNEYHTGIERLNSDSTRRNELLGLEISVISITNDKIKHRGSLEADVRTIAKRTSKRLRFKEPQFSHANWELKKCLFRTTSL